MTTFDKNKDLILDALIKLYLDVKVRNPEEVENYTDKKLEEERSSLLKIDIFTIITSKRLFVTQTEYKPQNFQFVRCLRNHINKKQQKQPNFCIRLFWH